MYRPVDRNNSRTLISQVKAPDLTCTEEFMGIIRTLPSDCPIPVPIIKFGILTKHIEPKYDDIKIDFDDNELDSTNEAVVPPQTLAGIRYILYNSTDDLISAEKKRVGKFCEKAKLNQPKESGAPESAVIEAVSDEDYYEPGFLTHEKAAESTTTGESRSESTEASKSTDTASSQSKKHSCTHCGKEYDSAARLKGHERKCRSKYTLERLESNKKYKKEPEHSCSYCDETFKYEKKREWHEKKCKENTTSRTTSSGKSDKKSKKYQCSYCDKRFRKKKNKKFHEKKCDEKPTSRTTSDKNPFSGVEIKKSRGSERKTGRSPFSDSDLIKDTLVKGPKRKDK